MNYKIKMFFCMVVVGATSVFASQIKVAGGSEDPYMMPYYTGVIVPTPQQAEYKGEYISLIKTAIILNDIKQDDSRLKYLLERITRYGGQYEIVKESAPEHSCIIIINDEDLKLLKKNKGMRLNLPGKFSLLEEMIFRDCFGLSVRLIR